VGINGPSGNGRSSGWERTIRPNFFLAASAAMDDRPQPEHRVGEPPDAAALHSILAEAFATYRD